MAAPFKFQDAEKLSQLIDEYFKETKEEEWTVTGLALHLDCDRDTLLNYQKREDNKEVNKEVIRLIKRSKLKVENGYEKDLKKHGRSGTIFGLKNFGWVDKQELDHTSKGESISVNIITSGNKLLPPTETGGSTSIPKRQDNL